MSDLKVSGRSGLKGVISVPGDKSISHRAIILGSLASGTTRVHGFLESADCLNTIKAFRMMGVDIKRLAAGEIEITGAGLSGLKEPADIIDVGNSGTAIRLISGVLAGQPFYSVITGDESVRNRPMKRIVEPLKDMGALVHGRAGGDRAPLTILGGELWTIDHKSPVASAQVKSAVLLAGLFADGRTTVTEPAISRNHTELMLKAFGADVKTEVTAVSVAGRPRLEAREISVPGDVSSAACWLAAALIVPNSEITVKNVGINPTRTGILDVLESMGADISVENIRGDAGEPAADITARASGLKGTEISGDMVPRLIDEIPIIAVAAAKASDDTVISGAGELRLKETDRIAAVAAELTKFGVSIEETTDGMIIHGGSGLTGTECSSHGDHRIAMSLSIAALAAQGETVIRDAGWIETSYPQFAQTLNFLCGS
ncbi:MAG: 3-phosphoshikimate 1-carboxyvinyltransferase [Armatimonadota bacterium]